MNAKTNTLAAAYVAAFAEIEGAAKSAKNPHYKSKYADLPSVIAAIKPALLRHGLAFWQLCEPSEDGVTVETILVHMSGEERSLGKLFVPANKRDAQGFGSAQTYARRFSLQTAFGVPAEDDDGNAASTGLKQQLEASVEMGKQPAHSKLKTELRGFVHEMEGIGDWDEWIALRETRETKALLANVQENLPQWWDGGEDMPDEFVPLRRRIELLEANLANQIADVARA
jgi:hypothetical protein